MKNRYFVYALAALLIPGFKSLQGQNLDTIRLSKKIPVLNNRAYFSFPAGTENVKRQVNIMAADPNDNIETRLVMDIGTMRIVFFAQEIYTLAGSNVRETATGQDAGGLFMTKMLSDADSMQSFLSTPTSFDSTRSAIIVNSLLVKTPDNTLFRISAYINPEAYPLREAYQKLTAQIFGTLAKGTRKNNLAAHQETLPLFGANKSFTFNVPANYAITVDQQYDFQVFKFHRYQLSADTSWVQLIIYIGRHPSVVYADYGLSESEAQKTKGKFLGDQIDWMQFNIKKEGLYDKEQKIRSNKVDKDLLVHIAMLSNREQLLEELTGIVENIRLTKK